MIRRRLYDELRRYSHDKTIINELPILLGIPMRYKQSDKPNIRDRVRFFNCCY